MQAITAAPPRGVTFAAAQGAPGTLRAARIGGLALPGRTPAFLRGGFALRSARALSGGRAARSSTVVVRAAKGFYYETVYGAKELMDGEGFNYLDVQSIPEWNEQHVKNSINVPYKSMAQLGGQLVENPGFLSQVNEQFPDKDTRLLLGCWTGTRAEDAASILAKDGYTNLVVIEGGYRAWNRVWNSSGRRREHGVFVDTGPTTFSDTGEDPDNWGKSSNYTPSG